MVAAESNHPRKRAYPLVFKGGGWWRWRWWQRATALENEYTRSSSRVEGGAGAGGGKEHPPSKTSIRACFQGSGVDLLSRVEGWCWKGATPLENEHTLLVFEGGGRKRARVLIFESGGGGGVGKTLH